MTNRIIQYIKKKVFSLIYKYRPSSRVKKKVLSLIYAHKSHAVTGRVQSWLDEPTGRLPVSCTVFSVEDSMEGTDSIEESWLYLSKNLRYGAGVAIDLSKLRPADSLNKMGLKASGPVSFMEIYSDFNKILRRGGLYKGGACVVYLDADHPDLLLFLGAQGAEFAYIKKALYVEESTILKNPNLPAILDKVRDGTIWLAKKNWDAAGNRLYSQVCVTNDTWIMTSEGARQVSDLLGTTFHAHVNDASYVSVSPPVVHEELEVVEPSGYIGFFSTGINDIYELTTKEGYKLRATANHLVQTTEGLKELGRLTSSDKVVLSKVSNLNWTGNGSFEEGWMLGSLCGDGTFYSDTSAQLKFWGEFKEVESAYAVKSIHALGEVIGSNNRNYGLPTKYVTDDFCLINSSKLGELAAGYDITKGNKKITPAVEKSSKDFYRGFLRGYYDADATVQRSDDRYNGKSISLSSVEVSNIYAVQRMLLRLGIKSSLSKGQPSGYYTLPDGKGGSKEYNCNQTYRLIISGRYNMTIFSELVGFNHPAKQSKLLSLLQGYCKEKAYAPNFTCTVESVEYDGKQETFDASISDVHKFDANGIIVSNCLEILLPHRGSCLLMHNNLGALSPEEIPEEMSSAMTALCELHAITGAGKGNMYLTPDQDRQVGLGVLGLANFLANQGVTYKQFVEESEKVIAKANDAEIDLLDYGLHFTHTKEADGKSSTKAAIIVSNLLQGFKDAAEVARSYNMDRAFCVAPTATCSFKYKDVNGFTTAPEISPPICHPVTKATIRDSDTFGAVEYFYPLNVETAEEVGWDVYYRLLKVWQTFMEATGLAHSISANIWNQCEVDMVWLKDWLASPLVTTYYRMMTEQGYADKTSIAQDLDGDLLDGDFFFPEEDVPTGACEITCTSCAE